jgi:hypothetical protein
MKFATKTLAMLLISAGIAHADVTAQIVADLQAAGYTRIEIKRSATLLKVEAIRDGVKLERIIDRESGAILKEEVAEVSNGAAEAPSVEVSDEAALEDDSDDGSDEGVDGSDDDGSDDSSDDVTDDSSDDGDDDPADDSSDDSPDDSSDDSSDD